MKLVITGGPSGGKTTIIEILKREYSEEIAVVPEAATILYSGGFPRIKTLNGRLAAQRSIFWVQRELEILMAHQYPDRLIVCDRGSLDGAAYWPKQASQDFFNSLKTSEADELDRYDFVLHLDTADENHFDTSNPVRTETHEEALKLNKAILDAWTHHPHRIRIKHQDNFLKKIDEALHVVAKIVKTYRKIKTKQCP